MRISMRQSRRHRVKGGTAIVAKPAATGDDYKFETVGTIGAATVLISRWPSISPVDRFKHNQSTFVFPISFLQSIKNVSLLLIYTVKLINHLNEMQ